MSREEGRKRNGTAQQQGRKGRGSDRAARLHRSDYRATIIANGHVRLRGEKKRERKEKKEKKGVISVSCENSNFACENRQHIVDRRIGSRERNGGGSLFEGDVKIEISLNASTGWNANYAQSEVEAAEKGDGTGRFSCNI